MLATEETVDAIESLLLLFTDVVEALTLAELTEGDRFDAVFAVGGDGNLPNGVMAAGFGAGGDDMTGNLLLLLLLAIEGGLLLSVAAFSLGDFMLLGG